MMLRKVVFWFDLAFVVGVLILFAIAPADKVASLGNVLLAGPGPVLAVLNAGISASVFAEKRAAKK